MPCFGPLAPGEQFRLLSALALTRRRSRWACAAAVACLLLGPSALHRLPVTPAVAGLPLLEEPAAFLGPQDEALSAGRLPEKFPEGWRKPPCPKAKDVEKIQGACFMVLKSPPPCGIGYDDGKGRCVYPIAERQDAPRSIGR